MKYITVNFRFEFVTNAPKDMELNVLYISIPYSMVLHLCPCGCGKEVATKISPSRWTLKYDGESVSLSPSIRNTGLPCQSHYFITKNKVEWAYDTWPDDDKKTKKKKKKFSFWGNRNR